MKEELTTKMHNEFKISAETAVKHRAFSALRSIKLYSYTQQAAATMYNVSTEDIERFKPDFKALEKSVNGADLYNKHTAYRDFSGSQKDEYAQLLMTIHSHIGDEIFDLLEAAEIQSKHLYVTDGLADEITANIVGLKAI